MKHITLTIRHSFFLSDHIKIQKIHDICGFDSKKIVIILDFSGFLRQMFFGIFV